MAVLSLRARPVKNNTISVSVVEMAFKKLVYCDLLRALKLGSFGIFSCDVSFIDLSIIPCQLLNLIALKWLHVKGQN